MDGGVAVAAFAVSAFGVAALFYLYLLYDHAVVSAGCSPKLMALTQGVALFLWAVCLKELIEFS